MDRSYVNLTSQTVYTGYGWPSSVGWSRRSCQTNGSICEVWVVVFQLLCIYFSHQSFSSDPSDIQHSIRSIRSIHSIFSSYAVIRPLYLPIYCRPLLASHRPGCQLLVLPPFLFTCVQRQASAALLHDDLFFSFSLLLLPLLLLLLLFFV
ncbi:hypothetical protein GGR50DRAFT_619402 [Xylaria sp. CBS 124048]|nr:hypothetical protein GGR50DRAFT_619402 [Xylaria sp. CBS 124048]